MFLIVYLILIFNIIFLWEKIVPKLVVFQSRRKLQVLEKNVFRKKKKFVQLICADNISKRCAEIFLK